MIGSGRRSAILNLLELKLFFMVYPYIKLHILLNSNGHFEFDRVIIFQDASSAEISHFIL